MSTILDLKAVQQEALNKADATLKAAEAAGRAMTAAEQENYSNAMGEYRDALATQKAKEEIANLHLINPARILTGVQSETEVEMARQFAEYKGSVRRVYSKEYYVNFMSALRAGFKNPNAALAAGYDAVGGGFAFPSFRAALSEGTTTAGGYAVPSVVDDQIVPLAPPPMAVESIATVIPTTSDIKFPTKTSLGTAAAKAESGGSTNNFGGGDPAIGQFTLTAWMAGHLELGSWELLQDVPAFQAFLTDDILLSIAEFKENWYVNGTGSSQAQGLIGNTGTGSGAAYELVGTASTDNATLLNAIQQVDSFLNPVYDPGAVFLMQKATLITLRAAQSQANLFYPLVTMGVNGRYQILGKDVYFSAAMPSLPTATNAGVVPILFGDFKKGYLIGHRGGSGVNIKILDQPYAVAGQLGILGYQRVDGKIRRSEAIQQIEVSHS